MARVTIEDCLDKVESKFELVLLASYRACQLLSGAEAEIERKNDKDAVLALREIAGDCISIDSLRNDFLHLNRDNVKKQNYTREDKESFEQSKLIEEIIIADSKSDEKRVDSFNDEQEPIIG